MRSYRQILPICKDCGLPYQEFGLDTTLPDEQWLMIHPEGLGGLLCANCIVNRASHLSGIIAARMILEIAVEKATKVQIEKYG